MAGLADIDGKRVAVLSGSAGDLAARKRFAHAAFQVAPAAADAALAVRNSKADAFVYDRSVLLNLVERNPDLVIIDEPVAKLEVAAAIAMGNSGDPRYRQALENLAASEDGVVAEHARWALDRLEEASPR